jgi:hypothetical protein
VTVPVTVTVDPKAIRSPLTVPLTTTFDPMAISVPFTVPAMVTFSSVRTRSSLMTSSAPTWPSLSISMARAV